MSVSRLINAEAARLECPVGSDDVERLSHFVALLSRWSGRIRLTSSADPAEIVTRHLVDSLVLSAALPAAEGPIRCVDVGAGGGLPGLPCALLRPDLSVTFVESNARKCAFLRTAAHELGVECEVACKRVEQHAMHAMQRVDLAWSRATFAPAAWLACAAKLLRPDGLVAVFTAQRYGEAADGFERVRQWDYALADGAPRLLTLLRSTTGP